jgi:hypothetical protein
MQIRVDGGEGANAIGIIAIPFSLPVCQMAASNSR